MKLFDAHCHFPESDIGSVMERATDAGVEKVTCCGTSPEDWDPVLQLPATFPQVVPMIGVHPWFVDASWKPVSLILKALLMETPGAGIGETGLDFSSFASSFAKATADKKASADKQERFTNRAAQEASFAAHLDLARELNRPVAVHCVRAWGRLIEILREHPAPRVLLHAFGGAVELIPELVDLNGWFSFCGSVTNPNAKRVRAAVAAVPADRLLIETDAPDFPPQGCEPPNEPANLPLIAETVADLRKQPAGKIAELTFENAMRFF